MKIKKLLKPLKIIGVILLAIFIAGALLFLYYIKDLPRPEKFTEGEIPQVTKIYDRTGDTLLYEVYGDQKRTLVPLSEISKHLKNAVVAIEDKEFYKHHGIDLEGIMRALLHDLKVGEFSQGGSTITQQLIRSYFLTKQKTLKRKSREAILAWELEREYSKKQILGWYLNLIPFGSNIYGVEEASQFFFNKHANKLTIPESAILASLIKSPSYLSPFGNHKKQLLQRKNIVLSKMKKQGFITPQEYQKAKEKKIEFNNPSTQIKAPHFTLFVKNKLEQKYGEKYLKTEGLKIYTTLNYKIQKEAQKKVKKGVKNLEQFNVHNGGLIALDPNTGEVISMVGSKNWFGESQGCNKKTNKCKFDPKTNVTISKRQPGSSIKPLVYAKSFLEGFTPRSLIWDVKTEFNQYCSPDTNEEKGEYGNDCYHPKNYTGRHYGLITIKQALAQSINVAAVKTLYIVGLKDAINFLNKMGLTSLKKASNYGLSLVLGGGEVKLLNLTSAYSVFTNQGIKKPLTFIKRIEDSQGDIIQKNNQKSGYRVIPSYITKEISDILSSNKARAPMFGSNSLLRIKNYDVAVKTGTTQKYKDAWTLGYSPSVVVGVWVGNNNNAQMAEKPSVVLAGKIWNDFITYALKKFPKKQFEEPKERKTNTPMLNGKSPKEKHSLLYFLDKKDPLYRHWEKGVKNYLEAH